MENLTIEQITELQKGNGVYNMQELITSGQVWKFEGSFGRTAMNFLDLGVCYLPEVQTSDYYGNTIPSRGDLQPGTKGTFENSQRYWSEEVDN